uniref:Uncharacterized protein n=1 Tax=Timema cristinae TaxID=61476 RepID=A0A7R9D1M5_TIMCR|nr:unnamed protein product [Timema cristinae]
MVRLMTYQLWLGHRATSKDTILNPSGDALLPFRFLTCHAELRVEEGEQEQVRRERGKQASCCFEVAGSGGEWTDEAIDMFEELARVAKWELMMARVNCYKERSTKRAKRAGSPVPCVELYDTSNKQHVECEAPSFNTKIFDGATVVHVLPIVETAILKEYSDVMFLPWLHTQLHSCKRVDVVWDMYKEDSLKAFT